MMKGLLLCNLCFLAINCQMWVASKETFRHLLLAWTLLFVLRYGEFPALLFRSVLTMHSSPCSLAWIILVEHDIQNGLSEISGCPTISPHNSIFFSSPMIWVDLGPQVIKKKSHVYCYTSIIAVLQGWDRRICLTSRVSWLRVAQKCQKQEIPHFKGGRWELTTEHCLMTFTCMP